MPLPLLDRARGREPLLPLDLGVGSPPPSDLVRSYQAEEVAHIRHRWIWSKTIVGAKVEAGAKRKGRGGPHGEGGGGAVGQRKGGKAR